MTGVIAFIFQRKKQKPREFKQVFISYGYQDWNPVSSIICASTWLHACNYVLSTPSDGSVTMWNWGAKKPWLQ